MSSEGPSPISVLIVDDHPVVRQGMCSMLQAADVKVVGEAKTGSEAVLLVEALQPDVTLMDIRMPDMDGLAAMAAMKRRSLTTSVIVITTYSSVQYLTQAVICGAAGYFMKGISRDQLLEAVRAVASGESLLQVRHLRTVIERLAEEDLAADGLAGKPLELLTRREREVLHLVAQGLTNKQIAGVLGVSRSTVKTHVEHIIGKLGVSDRTQAAVWAVRAGVAGL